MGDIVIVAYRPKNGCDAALRALVRDHVPALRRFGLATARPALALGAADGAILEVFEWEQGAIATAHTHPDVLALWARFDAVSDHVPLKDLAETQDLFARFDPLD